MFKRREKNQKELLNIKTMQAKTDPQAKEYKI